MDWSIALFMLSLSLAIGSPGQSRDSSLGSCWQVKQRPRNNLCGKPLRAGVTREKCCSTKFRRSWSTFLPKEVIFANSTSKVRAASKAWVLKYRNSILNSPPDKCYPCATSCRDVKCGENEKCVMKKGLPKCVCSPECHLQHKAAVCGTDGKTYKSECHLLKRSCRKRKKLKIAHSGKCQTCADVKCHKNKSCVLDTLLNAKCVKCPSSCERVPRRRGFCGTDGLTYTSKCQARMASCRSGKVVHRAYRGPCREKASCATARCWRHESCLTEVSTGQPRCWKCGDYHNCPQTRRQVCTTDGRTYQTWCEFRLEACRSGKVFDAVPLHQCPKKIKNSAKKKVDCSKLSQNPSEQVNSLIKTDDLGGSKGSQSSVGSSLIMGKRKPLPLKGSLNKKLRKERRRKKRRKRKEKIAQECASESLNHGVPE